MSETFRNFSGKFRKFSVPEEFYKQRYRKPATFSFCCFNTNFTTLNKQTLVVLRTQDLCSYSKQKNKKFNFKILSTKNMFGLNRNYNRPNDYLRPQHFHSVLLVAASCSLLGSLIITETNCTPLFLLHSTPKLALKYVSKCGHCSKI